jgi:hypothetical protein
MISRRRKALVHPSVMQAEGEVLQLPVDCVETRARFDEFVEDEHDRLYKALYFVTEVASVLLVGGTMGTLSPDGSTLAVSCMDRFAGGICITHADGTNLRALVSGPSYGPIWSPDGTRIAYINDNYSSDKVFVVDVATGETTFVADGTAAEWLDDHTLIIEGRRK